MRPDLVVFDCAGVLVDSERRVAPAGCVVIEDSPFGVRAGVAAGMRVLGYGGGLAAPGLLAEAGAEVFGRMSEVPALLGV